MCKPSLIHNGTAPVCYNGPPRSATSWKPWYRWVSLTRLLALSEIRICCEILSGRPNYTIVTGRWILSFRNILPGIALLYVSKRHLRTRPVQVPLSLVWPASSYWRKISVLCVRTIPTIKVSGWSCATMSRTQYAHYSACQRLLGFELVSPRKTMGKTCNTVQDVSPPTACKLLLYIAPKPIVLNQVFS
jgi:hypothetical protein